MRHAKAAVLLLAAPLLALGGCTLSIYNNLREMESLEVVQALGIDAGEDGGVRLSAATGSDASGREPLRLSCEGSSFEGAMRELEALSGAGSLLFSGTGAIVLGESAAAQSGRWLDAVARSDQLRLDTELFVLRGDEAAGLIAGPDAPEDVFAALNALSRRMSEDGPASAATCTAVSRQLIEQGAALTAAVELEEGADGKLTPVPAGLAVLSSGGMTLYLTDGAAAGAGMFLDGPGTAVLELGGGVTAELAGAGIELEPVWDGEGLERLCLSVSISAGVIEAPPGTNLAAPGAWEALELELAETARGWTVSALEASRESGLDFLGLERELERRFPRRAASLGRDWPGSMEFSVTAEGRLLNAREFAVSPYGGEDA